MSSETAKGWRLAGAEASVLALLCMFNVGVAGSVDERVTGAESDAQQLRVSLKATVDLILSQFDERAKRLEDAGMVAHFEKEELSESGIIVTADMRRTTVTTRRLRELQIANSGRRFEVHLKPGVVKAGAVRFLHVDISRRVLAEDGTDVGGGQIASVHLREPTHRVPYICKSFGPLRQVRGGTGSKPGDDPAFVSCVAESLDQAFANAAEAAAASP